jgi:hypothetical protein
MGSTPFRQPSQVTWEDSETKHSLGKTEPIHQKELDAYYHMAHTETPKHTSQTYLLGSQRQFYFLVIQAPSENQLVTNKPEF